MGKPVVRGYRAGVPWACGREAATATQTSLPYLGPESRKCGAEPRWNGTVDCFAAALDDDRSAVTLDLVRFPPLLLAQSLPRKRFLRPAFLAGLHVEAVLLDFLDDVFLLHLALESAQGIFQRFTLLDNDFGHFLIHPQSG